MRVFQSRVCAAVAVGVTCAILIAPGTSAQMGISVNATTTMTSDNDEAYELNTMNRSDNPFSPARLTFLAGGKLNENTSLFVEVPFDVQSLSSTFVSYIRPFVRIENIGGKPWLNLQSGKLATPWGTYGERSASPKNAVIGMPLLYYYRTALRPEFVYADADAYISGATRGGGYEFTRSGDASSYHGVPLIYESCWNLGSEVFGATHGWQYSIAALMGTVSHPAMTENYNDGFGFSGRLGYLAQSGPLFGLRVGASAAMGPYLPSEVADLPEFPAGKSPEDFVNTAYGTDLSYAWGHWTLQAEGGNLRFEVPNIDEIFSANSFYLELERKLGPNWSIGARRDGIAFSTIQAEGHTQKWDWDMNRWETSLAYRFQPGSRIRAGYQWSMFPGHSDLNEHMFAVQLQVWTQ